MAGAAEAEENATYRKKHGYSLNFARRANLNFDREQFDEAHGVRRDNAMVSLAHQADTILT